jgi:hypothetical protein
MATPGRRCVDGGYTPEQAQGMTAFAGADLGLSMTLLAIDGVLPKQAFEIVHGFLTSRGEVYTWHSDKHTEESDSDEPAVGCGHNNASLVPDNEGHFGISSSDSAELLSIVREKTDNGLAEKVVLDREHTENGLMIIHGSDYTVQPWNPATNQQSFIYDVDRHQQLVRELAEYCRNEKQLEITDDQLLKIADTQTNATLGLLGTSRGAPIYDVHFDDEGKPLVSAAGYAPDYTTTV